jgi:long-chain acyl-CoA synthetase
MTTPFPNLGLVLRHQAARLGPRPALRHRRFGLFRDISWDAYHSAARGGAAALIHAGVKPGERVGIVAENSVDWLAADMAILTAGAVTVSPHAPLTARQIHYQLHHSGAVWCFISNAEQMAKVESMRGELPALRGVVSFDPLSNAIWWPGFRASADAEITRRLSVITPDDLAAVMYTSGTTGDPKGVMLTHGNILSNTYACLDVKPHRPGDVTLSWLPFTHIYARTVDHYGALCAGITLAVATSVDTLVADLADVRPTHMSSVPRFYEKLLASVAHLPEGERHRRLRAYFGGRVDWISSGGAPLPTPVAREYHAAGVMLMQGYGLTESSPVITFNIPTAHRIGTVGRALPGVDIRIGEDGEVMTRGPHVMKGYWRDKEATRETIRDGWLHTGDLGSIDEDGYLTITGRKKELLVLSNGKKIAPSNLECLLCSDPYIEQAVVVGEGRNFLSALIVPRWDALRKDADDADAAAFLLGRCEVALRELSRMEQIRKVAVVARPFSVAADEMTVSLKLRRNVIVARHAGLIEALYRAEE